MKKRFLFLIIFSVLFFLFFPVKQANAQVSCFKLKTTTDGLNNPQLPSPGQSISVNVEANNDLINGCGSVGAGYKMEVVWQLRNPEGTSIMTQYFTPKIDSYTLVGDVPPGLSATHTFTTSIGSGETCSTFGSKVTVVAFLSAPTEKSSDFIYTVSSDNGGIGAKLYGNVTDNTGNLTSANVIISPADYSAGSYSAGGGFYEFNGLDCSHNHTVTATSTTNGQTTTKTVYAAYAGSPSLCNGEGARVDLSLPAPPTCTNCDSGVSCSSTCTPSASNTCSAGNGTKSCIYTTCSVGGTCTPAAAPDQICDAGDHCSAGYTCTSGSCVPNSSSCNWAGKTADPIDPNKGWDCGGSYPGYGTDSCSSNACVGVPYQCNAGSWSIYNPPGLAGACTTACTNCRGGASPTPTPTASPTVPPSSDQPCGSCSTGCGGDSSKSHCYGVAAGGGLVDMGCLSKNVCFQAGDGTCKWDPTSCKDPAPPLTGDSPPFFTVNLYACDAGEFDPDHNGNGYDDTYSCNPTGTEINVEPGHVVDFQLKGWNYSTDPTRMVPDYDMWGLFNQAQPGTKSLGEVRDWDMGPSEGSFWRWNCAPGDDWANDHQPTDLCKRVNQCWTSWNFETGACGITWKKYDNVDGTCRNAVGAGTEGLPYGWWDSINYIARIDPAKVQKGTKITTRGLFHKIAYIGPSGYLPVGYEAKLFQERVPNNQIGLLKSLTPGGSEWWGTLNNNWGKGFGPAYSTCNSNENLAFFSNWVTINVKTIDPWIQVVGGDVHSNSGINVSGGP